MFFIVSVLMLGGCTQRMICPAYQSAFIYDQASLRKKFSYFVDDSTPKVFTASKNKYLIAEPVTYQHKIRQMATVEMKPVYPIVPDSLQPGYQPASLAELDSAARSVIDSTYIVDVTQQPADSSQSGEDSVYVITKDKEVKLLKYDMDSLKYSVVDVRLNVDQDNYMWYLRDHLVLPDVRLAKMQNASKETAKEKTGFFGFFKNLFKKKKKEKVDSAHVVPVNKGEEEYDYVDTLEQERPAATQQPQTKTKKKGLFSFLKKDKTAEKSQAKEEDAITPPEEKPAKKKKEKKKKEEPVEETPTPEQQKEKDDGF
jgi:hypothetical protein